MESEEKAQHRLTEEQEAIKEKGHSSVGKKQNSENKQTTKNIQLATPVFLKNDLLDTFEAKISEGNLHGAAESLSLLLNQRNISLEYVLHAGIALLEEDGTCLKDLLQQVAISNSLNHDKIKLLQILQLLKEGNFRTAFETAQTADKKVVWTQRLESFESAAVVGYRALLSFYLKKQENVVDRTVYGLLSDLYEHNTNFLPFSEAFGEALFQVEGHEALKNFVEDWCGRPENREFGVVPYLQCLKLITSFIPNTKRLKFQVLERIAATDPSNVHVLDLCRILLRNEVPDMDSETEESSNSFDEDDSGNEETGKTAQNREKNILHCFRTVLEFLDYEENSESPEAWRILSETLFSICLLGTKDCAREVVSSWHRNRKAWWPQKHFLQTLFKVEDHELTKYLNKGVVCFVLESEDHEYVKNLQNEFKKKAVYLTSSINQLRAKKQALDKLVERFNNKKNDLMSLNMLENEEESSETAVEENNNDKNDNYKDEVQNLQFVWSSDDNEAEDDKFQDEKRRRAEKSEDATSSEEENEAEAENESFIDVMALTRVILQRRKVQKMLRESKKRKT